MPDSLCDYVDLLLVRRYIPALSLVVGEQSIKTIPGVLAPVRLPDALPCNIAVDCARGFELSPR